MHKEGKMVMIATEFSAYPAGRDANDGPNNGGKFRDEILLPRVQAAIAAKEELVVSLDGVMSFGSSFLEEAFGGLVRKGVAKKDLKKYLIIEATMPGANRYLEAIDRYIDRARA